MPVLFQVEVDMAEGRMLKRNVSTSRKLAELKSDSARLLWTWMLPHLDVAGRFSGEPSVVKGAIVPRLKHLTEEKVGQLLLELHEVGLVRLYAIGGERYIEVSRFEDFQNLRTDRESESRIPEPPDIKGDSDDSRMTPGAIRDNAKAKHDLTYKDKDRDKDKDKDTPEFSAWWSRYPRKVAKKVAAKSYAAAIKAGAKPEDLLKAIDGYLIELKKNGTEERFVLHASTFLHEERWRDYLERPAVVQVGQRDPRKPKSEREIAYESARAAKLAELSVVGGDPDYIKEQLASWSEKWWAESERGKA
jgi:hypothetical protein